MSFSQGLSGLNAASKALDVVGNNIANSQTSGFKAGSISFADIFAGSDGLGVQVTGISQDFKDGGLSLTGRKLDIGISGRGFFRMQNEAGGVFYGRNSDFDLDKNGNIINKTNGMFLTGYQATGTPPKIEQGAPVDRIHIPTGDMSPKASTSGSLTGNLKADDAKISKAPFKIDDPATYNYTSQVEATDSLGNKHTIKLYFVQESAGKWSAYARDDTAPLDEAPEKIELKFDANGKLTEPTTPINVKGKSFNGANALDLKLDLSAITKYSGDSTMKLKEIDGQAPGKYQTYAIGEGGEVEVTYTNGKKQIVAQIVLADFANSGGLTAKGSNLWEESPQSGQPTLGTSGSGSFGQVKGFSKEASNVDMGQEMVNMIVHQRNYQSNSQTIKTQSELLQTLVNLR